MNCPLYLKNVTLKIRPKNGWFENSWWLCCITTVEFHGNCEQWSYSVLTLSVFLLLLIASFTTLCWHSADVLNKRAPWLKLNNFVGSWWNVMKFCITVINPVLDEVQLKFPITPYTQTCTNVPNVSQYCRYAYVHATLTFFKFLKVQWLHFTGEVEKCIIFRSEISSIFCATIFIETGSFFTEL